MKTTAMLAAILLGWGASGGSGSDDAEDERPSGATCPRSNTRTYENFGRYFVRANCTRCPICSAPKSAPAGHNYDTLRGILSIRDHIDEHAAAGPDGINTAMPPNRAKPTDHERRKLGAVASA